MAHREPSCKLPFVFMRRQGTVWCCPECDKLWTIRWYWNAYWSKEWFPVLDGEQ